MHRCLQIPELVAMILDLVYMTPSLRSRTDSTIPYEPPDTGAVLSFALTCRAFLEPSLDVLWYKQISLGPLWLCFPSAVGEGRSISIGERVQSREDWARVLFYARRIRELEHEDSTCVRLMDPDKSIFSIISVYRPVLCIFPSLRSIVCRSSDMLHHIHIFLGPKLERFVYINKKDEEELPENALVRLPPSLMCMSPSLRSLVLDISPDRCDDLAPSFDSELCEIAVSLPSLEEFCFQELPVSEPTLTGLSQIPNLFKMTVYIAFDFGSLPISAGFPSLKELFIATDSIGNFLSLLKHVSSPAVGSVALALDTLPTAGLLESAFQALKEHKSGNELHQIHVRSSDYWIDDETNLPTPIIPKTLLPLLGLPISTIHISLPCAYDIPDSLIKDLAMAWPNLEVLHLMPPPDSEDTGMISLTAIAIVHLAIHCRKLRMIFMIFDATEVPGWDYLEEMRPFGGYSVALTMLIVGNSPIKNPTEVADFLSEMFGYIQVIAWQGHGRVTKRWKEVNRIIPTFIYPTYASSEGETGEN